MDRKTTDTQQHLKRIWALVRPALSPPPGGRRIALALLAGGITHLMFAAAVLAMVLVMASGMTWAIGNVPSPYSHVANLALLVQFPLVHSLLLSPYGARFLGRGQTAAVLSTTTYALIASAQLLALFMLWTPSGVIWWRADGLMQGLCLTAYGLSWLYLMKASFDAGAEVQSGALGWLSLLADRMPQFPGLPTSGTFRFIRHPIYLAFALTTWTVPVWTPDQLMLAVALSAYCVLAPMLKERRLAQRHGDEYAAYAARTPYMLPRLRAAKKRGRPRRAAQVQQGETE